MIHTPQNIPFKILLADDDIDDRYFFEKALSEIPFDAQLKTVDNGESLMNYLYKNAEDLPDVLFLDLSMPRKTGFECLIEIKEEKKLANLRVIMFSTSYTRGIDLEDSLKNTLSNIGAEDYIRKPSDFKQFKDAIHQALIKVVERKV